MYQPRHFSICTVVDSRIRFDRMYFGKARYQNTRKVAISIHGNAHSPSRVLQSKCLRRKSTEYVATVLYSGTMFFWRHDVRYIHTSSYPHVSATHTYICAQLYADIDIVEHATPAYIEVCAFDVERHEELARAYLPLDGLQAAALLASAKDGITPSITPSASPSPTPKNESLAQFGLTVSRIRLRPADNRTHIVQQLLAVLSVARAEPLGAATLVGLNARPTKPEGVRAYVAARPIIADKDEFDRYVALVQDDIIHAALKSKEASELRGRGVMGVIVKNMRGLMREAKALRDSRVPADMWKLMLGSVRQREEVDVHRAALGMQSLPSLNAGEVAAMQATVPRKQFQERARREIQRARRMEGNKKHLHQQDGVNVNVHVASCS